MMKCFIIFFKILFCSILQAGQSSTLFFLSLCNVCRMWFYMVLLKNAWTSLENMCSWRQHMLLQNLSELFCINAAITEVEISFAKGADISPYHQSLAFGLVADNSLDAPSDLWSHSIHFFQLRSGILTGLTTIHVSTMWWSIPDASELREVDAVNKVNIRLLYCTVKFEAAFVNGTLYCSAWQRFPTVIPCPWGFLSATDEWWFLMQCRLRDWTSRTKFL